jgi:hypothetical protein
MTTPEEQPYSLELVSDNQAQINYLLNHTDKNVIDALKLIGEFLKAVKDIPQLAHALRESDLRKLDELLLWAEEKTNKVAGIKPPGCEPPPGYPTGG